MQPYILIAAGEDSGDILGESFVREFSNLGIKVKGMGGPRMEKAGLNPLVPYNELPVSGFFDVLPKYKRLKSYFKIMKEALMSQNCIGFIAIDYPGFNIKLSKIAKKFNKKSLYIAPPQIWAWKKNRWKKLIGTPLATLFTFEKECYAVHGFQVEKLIHPFSFSVVETPKNKIALFWGSRKSQALRNLKFYSQSLQDIHKKFPQAPLTIIASRAELRTLFESEIQKTFKTIPHWLKIEVAPSTSQERYLFYKQIIFAFTLPGTTTLELAVAGVPFFCITRTDFLTYFLGKLFIHTRYFAIPNILCNAPIFREFITCKRTFPPSLKKAIDAIDLHKNQAEVEKIKPFLQQELSSGITPQALITHFFKEIT